MAISTRSVTDLTLVLVAFFNCSSNLTTAAQWIITFTSLMIVLTFSWLSPSIGSEQSPSISTTLFKTSGLVRLIPSNTWKLEQLLKNQFYLDIITIDSKRSSILLEVGAFGLLLTRMNTFLIGSDLKIFSKNSFPIKPVAPVRNTVASL